MTKEFLILLLNDVDDAKFQRKHCIKPQTYAMCAQVMFILDTVVTGHGKWGIFYNNFVTSSFSLI